MCYQIGENIVKNRSKIIILESKLKKLEVLGCKGAVSSVIQNSAASLTELVVVKSTLDSIITQPMAKVEKLVVFGCRGSVSSLIHFVNTTASH